MNQGSRINRFLSRLEPNKLEKAYFCHSSMKKVVFLCMFFLLTTATGWNVSSAPVVMVAHVIPEGDHTDTEMPLGEGEESSEEDKDVTEEDDDDVSLDHRLHARRTSDDADLHILYQEILFKDLDTEVVIPPPKA